MNRRDGGGRGRRKSMVGFDVYPVVVIWLYVRQSWPVFHESMEAPE